MPASGYSEYIAMVIGDKSTMVSTDLLSNIPVFEVLSPRTRRYLAELATLVTFEAGTDLYRQGDAPTGLYALRAGRIKLHRQSKEKHQILGLPLPGDCLGAESLPTGAPSPYSATALTTATLIYLPPEPLQLLLDDLPDFQEVFLRLITDRLKQFVTLVHDLAFRDVMSRLATVLLSRAEAEGQPHEHGIVFDRLLSQQEYADMVGTAREVVYRTFRKLEEDHIIHLTRSEIIVLDLELLREIALQESR